MPPILRPVLLRNTGTDKPAAVCTRPLEREGSMHMCQVAEILIIYCPSFSGSRRRHGANWKVPMVTHNAGGVVRSALSLSHASYLCSSIRSGAFARILMSVDLEIPCSDALPD
jgi:hypothetical protein